MTHSCEPAQIGQLPLTESHAGSPNKEIVSESDIRALVDSFYETVQRDDLLGPIFARHVTDWSLHLPKMYDFWSTVILYTGRYAGRPLETHERLPGLNQDHFDHWVSLWERTVSVVIAPATQSLFTLSARRMAASMSSRLIA